MGNVKISVVIPVHNEEAFLEGVVRKIVECGADEVTIVDDGSTDGSPRVIERLVRSDPKITCLRIKENSGGCGFPREIGVLKARGEYVAFCDSDITNIDQVDYGRILEAARERRADLIVANYAGKVGRITNFIVKPMLHLFFPEININRMKTGQFCASKKLLKHFLKVTRFSQWNSTMSLIIFSYMNDYKVIEVDIGELYHIMRTDIELVQQAESAIKLILAWAGYYGKTSVLSDLTPPGSRRGDELPSFYKGD